MIRALFAAAFASFCIATTAKAFQKIISGWEVTCNNLHECVAIGDVEGDVNLPVRVYFPIAAGHEPYAIINIYLPGNEPVLFDVSITAGSSTLLSTRKAGLHTNDWPNYYAIVFDNTEAVALRSALQKAVRITVRLRQSGAKATSILLPSISPALAVVAEQQKLPPRIVEIRKMREKFVEIEDKPGKAVMEFVDKRCDDTEMRPDLKRQGYRLPGNRTLWEIYCNSGTRGTLHIYVFEEPGKAPYLARFIDAPEKNFGAHGLVGEFKTGTQELEFGEGGGGRCASWGDRGRFVFDGKNFRLAQYSAHRRCDGLSHADLPNVWRAQIK